MSTDNHNHNAFAAGPPIHTGQRSSHESLNTHLNNTIVGRFQQVCKSEPEGSIVHMDSTMTYRELDARSNALANELIWHGVQTEEVVAVVMTRSIDAVIAQLAILKAGAAYLPVSPKDFPIERIRLMLDDANVSSVIFEPEQEGHIEELQNVMSRPLKYFTAEHTSSLDPNETEKLLKPLDYRPDQLAYVMYTSGSTGQPKGVMISHENVVSTVVDSDYLTVSSSDSILHAAPISFDASTFEIWGALLNGVSLHIVSDAIVGDFNRFARCLHEQQTNIAWLTSALCNLIADTQMNFFKPLRLLLVGGEALSPRHINAIRQAHPKLVIRNNYGPTENTVFSCSHAIERDYSHNIPIGHATKHKRAYVLDSEMKEVSIGVKGELFVAGKGLAKGYLNRQEETQSRFIPDPFYPGEKMYATGDYCRLNAQGDIEFLGRKDTQVKIMGHRIELAEVEHQLMKLSGIKQAIVLYRSLSKTNKGIVAYVQPDDSFDAPIQPEALKEKLCHSLPTYMIPLHIELHSSFPVTLNGKVDRDALANAPLQTESQQKTPSMTTDSLEQLVRKTCCDILDCLVIDVTKSFFEQGGDSLSGTLLMVELSQALHQELPLQTLYANPVINNLIEAIRTGAAGIVNKTDTSTLIKDAQIDELIAETMPLSQTKTTAETSSCKSHQSPGSIFMTGATGFFGAFLLKELLSHSQAHITCLVRASSPREGFMRIIKTCHRYQIGLTVEELSRITALPGDLTQVNLGLMPEQFESLATSSDEIFHCGAAVNYVDTYEVLKASNVDGTREILRLSCLKDRIPLHYISSVSVFETLGFFRGTDMVFETDSVDASADLVKLGYSQSKWVAEKIMENAQNAGLPVNIFRAGYIMGHSSTGVSNTTDHIARYIAGCIEMGCAPKLDEYASLAPVDQLCAALRHITLTTQARGKTFHLCNPSFTTVSEIYQKIQDFGFPLNIVSYDEWKDRLAQTDTNNPLYPLLSLHIHPAPDHALTLPELYEHNARFDCRELLRALEGSDINIAISAPDIFERWLIHYINEGLIKLETFERAIAKHKPFHLLDQTQSASQHTNLSNETHRTQDIINMEVAC